MRPATKTLLAVALALSLTAAHADERRTEAGGWREVSPPVAGGAEREPGPRWGGDSPVEGRRDDGRRDDWRRGDWRRDDGRRDDRRWQDGRFRPDGHRDDRRWQDGRFRPDGHRDDRRWQDGRYRSDARWHDWRWRDGRWYGAPVHRDPRWYGPGRWYRHPPGYYGYRWQRGARLPPPYFARYYIVEDWRYYRLRPPPRGCHWVRVDRDLILAVVATGVVLEVLYDWF